MSDSTGVPSPSDVGSGGPQTPHQAAPRTLPPTETQSRNFASGTATSSTAVPSSEHTTMPPASNPPERTSTPPANPTTPESTLRKRRSKPLKQPEPYVKMEGKPSAKRAKQDARGLFQRSLAWIYAHSLGLVIAVVCKQCQGAYEGWGKIWTDRGLGSGLYFLFVTIPTTISKICCESPFPRNI
jgi:hypothetical protein